MKKHVLVLGAGRGQIPIIRILQNLGAFVTCMSVEGDYPGFEIADNFVYHDVSDKEGTLYIAKSLRVDAIISDQLDCAVTTAAYVSERLNIRGIPFFVANKFVNKDIMRKEALLAGVKVPRHFVAQNMEDIKQMVDKKGFSFPLIMKPIDAAASRGIHRLNGFSDIEKYFEDAKKWSTNGMVLVEQIIFGKEYVVDSYTHDYITTPLILGHRHYFEVDNLYIPSSTYFVDALSANSYIEEKVKKANNAFIKKSGLEFGITHGEFIVEENSGEVYLVEIAARGGGVFISSDLIPAASGVNAVELLVKDTLGVYEERPIVIKPGAAAYICYLVPHGVVSKIEGIDSVKSIPNVISAYFDNIFVGMKTTLIKDKGSRKGPILIKGKTMEECYDLANIIEHSLNIEIQTPQGLSTALWH